MSSNSDKPGYEKRDAKTEPLWNAALILVFVMGAAIFSMKALLDIFAFVDMGKKEEAFFVADERWQPPTIQLEVHPSKDYETFKAEQDKVMTEYAWVDPDNNIIRIPVERAVKLTAQRGLAARNGRYEDAGKALIPRESGSVTESRL